YTAAEKCDEFPPPHGAYPKAKDHEPIIAPCIAAKSGHSSPVRVIRVDLASGASPLVSRFQTYQAGCLSDVVPTTFLIQFAERVLRNIGSGLPRQSGLMLRVRMSLPHFSVSSAMSLPKSAGESASTSPPKLASRASNFGSASAVLISLLSL